MFARTIIRPISSSFRTLHTTTTARFPDTKHTADSYSKDVDQNPPPDSKIHSVGGGEGDVQRPHDPPSGKFSETGASAPYENVSKGYRGVSKEEPYKAEGEEGGETRYGAKGGEDGVSGGPEEK